MFFVGCRKTIQSYTISAAIFFICVCDVLLCSARTKPTISPSEKGLNLLPVGWRITAVSEFTKTNTRDNFLAIFLTKDCQ